MPTDLEAHPAPRLTRVAVISLVALLLFVVIITTMGLLRFTSLGRQLAHYVKWEFIPWLYQTVPPDALNALESTKTLHTYCIDSEWETNSIGEFEDDVGLHAHQILGERTIDDPTEVLRLVTGIKYGVYHGDMPMACFQPRHAVSVSNGQDTFDYLICFDCAWLYIYKRGEKQPLTILRFSREKEGILDLFPAVPEQVEAG